MYHLIISFFLFGFALGYGSCLASCGPLLISYLAGTQKNILSSVWAYIVFSLSRLIVYLILGMSVFFFGQFLIRSLLDSAARFVFIIGGTGITITGVLLAFDWNPDFTFCKKARDFLFKKDTKNIIVFGLVMSIIPCFPLLWVLSYIALSAKTWLNALILTLAFGAGTIFSPLFILAACTGYIPRMCGQTRALKVACGIIIAFLGIRLALKGL